MGLNIRPTSGRIANGSRLIVNGQPTTGSKVFTPSFKNKTSASKDSDFYVIPSPTPTSTPNPTPTTTPNPTPTPTPTFVPSSTPVPTLTATPTVTSTPTQSVTPTVTPTVTSTGSVLINPIIVGPNQYLSAGNNTYINFVNTTP